MGSGGRAAWDAITRCGAFKAISHVRLAGWLVAPTPPPLLRYYPVWFKDLRSSNSDYPDLVNLVLVAKFSSFCHSSSRISYPFVDHPVLSNVYLVTHTSWDSQPPVLCVLSQKKAAFSPASASIYPL